MIGLSIGIVPCPLSLTLMMIATAYSIFWVGLASVLSLTFSMALLLYLISLWTIKSRKGVARLTGTENSVFLRIKSAFNYLGNIGIIIIGSYLAYQGFTALFQGI